MKICIVVTDIAMTLLVRTESVIYDVMLSAE